MEASNYTKRAIVGSIISMFVILLGTFLLGELSGYEGKVLIKNSLSGINKLCNTIVLALLLTVLGPSSSSTSKLKPDHYKHILQIAKFDTIVFTSESVEEVFKETE